MTALPPHATMVANITDVYARSTREQQLAGIRWYPLAGRIVTAIADETGTDPYRVARCLAALSPRNPWAWNVQDAYAFAYASRHGEPRPSATTFERNRVAGWDAMTGATPWVTDAPKVRAFVRAIMGVRAAVVVDTWAYRVATGFAPMRSGSFKGADYEAIAAAYLEAATTLGQDPRDLQAITWIVAQAEGLASNRRNRHDLALKRGTGSFVAGLLAGA